MTARVEIYATQSCPYCHAARGLLQKKGVDYELIDVGREIRLRAPRATVLFVDYLTLLPATGSAPPLREPELTLGRHMATTLQQLTADAARVSGCGLVEAAAASSDHHAWSASPWTTKFGFPLPRRPAPLHPNAEGMRAVADLVVAAAT